MECLNSTDPHSDLGCLPIMPSETVDEFIKLQCYANESVRGNCFLGEQFLHECEGNFGRLVDQCPPVLVVRSGVATWEHLEHVLPLKN